MKVTNGGSGNVMPSDVACYGLEETTPIESAESLFVSRLQANDDAAYDELVRAYNSPMYHVALRMLGNSAEASDAVQDIFLKVFRSIKGFRGDSALKTWIYRIAFSEILNRLRWWKRRFRFATVSIDDGPTEARPSLSLRDGAPSPYRALETKERDAVIQAALNTLSKDHRSILLLRDIEGFSYSEIADVLGLSAGTVKSRLARGRADMKRALMQRIPAAGSGLGHAPMDPAIESDERLRMQARQGAARDWMSGCECKPDRAQPGTG